MTLPLRPPIPDPVDAYTVRVPPSPDDHYRTIVEFRLYPAGTVIEPAEGLTIRTTPDGQVETIRSWHEVELRLAAH